MDQQSPQTRLGLKLARRFGMLLGLFFLGYGPYTVLEVESAAGVPHYLRAAYIAGFGLLLLLPLEKAGSDRMFWIGFTSLCVIAAGFVFLMIVSVMFEYMAAAERDERLGVPGFQGTLVFFSLMQVPVILFLRRPDMID